MYVFYIFVCVRVQGSWACFTWKGTLEIQIIIIIIIIIIMCIRV